MPDPIGRRHPNQPHSVQASSDAAHSAPASAFRPDIEGLRALAILMVVAAHAGLPGLQGGFIGVDVFFVISGFLITRLLVEHQRRGGKIDFAAFYARRFRRLLPALLVMLAVSACIGWQLLPPSVQRSQAMAGMAASLWLSNLHFAFDNVGYFDPGSETNLYLHTWSLGIEEQFYLIWPALIALASAHRKSDSSARLWIAMIMLFFLSLTAEVLLSQSSASRAFYLMPARAWQFAAGALVYLSTPKAGFRWQIKTTIALAGAILLVCGLIFIGPDLAYPGLWAVLPTLGTACLIAAGSTGLNFVSRLLSMRPMRLIGAISYSWYLWHWPVLILGSTLVAVAGLQYRLLLVGVSLLLAIVSYSCIESPLRRSARLVVQPSRALMGALAVMVAMTAGFVAWASGAYHRQQVAAMYMHSRYQVRVPKIYSMGCDDWYASAELHVCEFGSPRAKNTVVAMGDSIGLQWFPALDRIFSAPDWRLLVLTKSSCPMVNKPFYYARIGREYTECSIWRQRSLDFIAGLKPTLVILGSTHTAHFSETDWIDGTRSLLTYLSPNTERIVVLRSTPHLPFDGAQCLEPRGILYRWLTRTGHSCAAPPHNAHSDRVAEWIAAASRPLANVSIVDMDDLVCPGGVCHAALNGTLVFRDSQHLNADFVAGLAPQLAERIGVPRQSSSKAAIAE